MALAHLTRSARLYVRSELMVARIRMRSETHRIMLLAVAAGLGLLGLVLVNIAVYAALLAVWGPVWTPLALGGADLVLAAVVLLAALTHRPGPELAMAEEMRNAAGANLEEQMQGGLTMPGLMGGLGGDSATARILLPLVGTLIGLVRKKKG